MNSSHKLIIKNLSKTFQPSGLLVLQNVSLHLDKGELVSIIGPSGCGKSTLLDCIAGLAKYNFGEIFFDNKKNHKITPFSYMMQDDNLLPWRNVLDNIILPLELAGIKKDKAYKEAEKLLHLFGLKKFIKYYPFMLSGGMRQRAALLRTYLAKKDVILLDEPFAHLDALTKRKMQEWFLNIWQMTLKSVLFVTHDVDEAIFLSDRIYVMSQRPGRIIKEIDIKIPRPRTRSVLTAKNFTTTKKQIIQLLMQEK